MQASKYILIRLIFCFVAAMSVVLTGCGEKTPEEIKAENQKLTDISVRRARVLMFEDKSSDAIKLLEDTYQKCGSSAELCEALAYAYAQNGQLASAAMFFENASAQKGGDPELQINAAKSYEQSKAYDSAIKAYEKYLKLKPSDVVAWKAISLCQENMKKYPEALNSIMSALKASGRNPNTAEAAKIGYLFIKVGNISQARKWLEAAYAATLPTNTETRKEILSNLIVVYLAQKDAASLEVAVASLDKIAPQELDKNYPELRAQLKAFRDNLKAAEEAMKVEQQKKIEAENKAKQEAEQQAKAEDEAKKKAAEEEKAKEKVEEKKPEPTPAPSEDKTKAEPDNTDAPAQEPDPLAEGEATIKDSEIKDAKTTDEKTSTYEDLVQKCYDFIAKNDATGAEKAAHLAIAKDSRPEAAWRALAKAYEISNKNNDSYMAAQEAYKRNPENIDATLFYLRNASRVLNNEKFLNEVYIAYEKFPNNPEIWVDLSRTYKLIGDKKNALFFYNHFLTHTPKEHPLYEEMSKEREEITDEK